MYEFGGRPHYLYFHKTLNYPNHYFIIVHSKGCFLHWTVSVFAEGPVFCDLDVSNAQHKNQMSEWMNEWIRPRRRTRTLWRNCEQIHFRVSLNIHFCVYVYKITHRRHITHMICRYNKDGLTPNQSLLNYIFVQFLPALNQIPSFPFFFMVLSQRADFWSLSPSHPSKRFPWVRAVGWMQRSSWGSWCLTVFPSLFLFLLSLHNSNALNLPFPWRCPRALLALLVPPPGRFGQEGKCSQAEFYPEDQPIPTLLGNCWFHNYFPSLTANILTANPETSDPATLGKWQLTWPSDVDKLSSSFVPTALGLQVLRIFSTALSHLHIWVCSGGPFLVILSVLIYVIYTSGSFSYRPLEGPGIPTQHSQMQKRRHTCMCAWFLKLYSGLIRTSIFNKYTPLH